MKRIIIFTLCLFLLLAAPVLGASSSSSSGRSYSSPSPSRSFSAPSSPSRSFSSPSTRKSYSAPSSPPKSPSQSWTPPKSTYDSSASRAAAERSSKSAYQASHPPPAPRYTPRSQADAATISRLKGQLSQERWNTREARRQQFFGTSPPATVYAYHDSFNPWFWMWLTQQNSNQQAEWMYHHKDQMDEQRYRDMLEKNAELKDRVAELEKKGGQRDTSYTPRGVDEDLMYDDAAVQPKEPKPEENVYLTLLAGVCALSVVGLFVWLAFKTP